MSPHPLGEYLASQRRIRRFTQKRIEELCLSRGYTLGQRTISDHETGKSLPRRFELALYSELYGCDFRKLVALAAADQYEITDPRDIMLVRDLLPVSSMSDDGSDASVVTRSDGAVVDLSLRSEEGAPASPATKKRSLRSAMAAMRTLLVVSVVAAVLLARSRCEVAVTAVRAADGKISAFSGERLAWQVPFPGLIDKRMPPLLHDVDADGRHDVLFAYAPDGRDTGRILCYDHKGGLRWEIALSGPRELPDRVLDPYWVPHHLKWIDNGTDRYVLIVSRHFRWYPSQVLLVDPLSGRVLGEYWHPGYLEAVTTYDVDSDGTLELLLGGVNNPGLGPGHPVIAVFDVPFRRRSAERSFFPKGHSELTYLVFPRPDFADVLPDMMVVVDLEPRPDGSLIVSVGRNGAVLYFYELEADLSVRRVITSDTTVQAHNAFTLQGHLDHRLSSDESNDWRRVVRFSAAPDGNSQGLRDRFEAR